MNNDTNDNNTIDSNNQSSTDTTHVLDPIRQKIKDDLESIVANFNKEHREFGIRYLHDYNITVHYQYFQTNSIDRIKYYIMGDDELITDWYNELDDALMAYINKCEVGEKKYIPDKNKKKLMIGSNIHGRTQVITKKTYLGIVRYYPERNRQLSRTIRAICKPSVDLSRYLPSQEEIEIFRNRRYN